MKLTQITVHSGLQSPSEPNSHSVQSQGHKTPHVHCIHKLTTWKQVNEKPALVLLAEKMHLSVVYALVVD